MNVLEKILEEIDMLIEKHKNKAFELVEKEPLTQCYTETDIEQIKVHELAVMKEIIRSHMDEAKDTNVPGKWIPVEERLPEEYDSIFAKFKGTDKWSDVMFEKKSDEVNVTVEFKNGTRKTGTSYMLDGKWKCEKENRFVKQKVVAWQPLPEQYKGER